MRPALVVILALCGASPALGCTDEFARSAYPASLVEDGATGGPVRRAWFDGPSTEYKHFVLGRTTEPSVLVVQTEPGTSSCRRVDAGAGHVFEDTAPRLADLDGDGTNEVIVVRSSVTRGAQLAVYGMRNGRFAMIAAMDPIGQSNRWLAPAGIADFTGDGRMEIAYVDRPHLLGELVFVRIKGDRLAEIARLEGLTNHRIGEGFISGGLRDCGDGPELVLASRDWSRMLRVLWADGPVASDIGPMPPSGLKRMPRCR